MFRLRFPGCEMRHRRRLALQEQRTTRMSGANPAFDQFPVDEILSGMFAEICPKVISRARARPKSRTRHCNQQGVVHSGPGGFVVGIARLQAKLCCFSDFYFIVELGNDNKLS